MRGVGGWGTGLPGHTHCGDSCPGCDWGLGSSHSVMGGCSLESRVFEWGRAGVHSLGLRASWAPAAVSTGCGAHGRPSPGCTLLAPVCSWPGGVRLCLLLRVNNWEEVAWRPCSWPGHIRAMPGCQDGTPWGQQDGLSDGDTLFMRPLQGGKDVAAQHARTPSTHTQTCEDTHAHANAH